MIFNQLLLQLTTLSLYALFMGFCFCDGFKLHIVRKLIWFITFLAISVYILKLKDEFDLALILPVPTLLAFLLCRIESRRRAGLAVFLLASAVLFTLCSSEAKAIDALSVIHSRKSVRQYTGQPVTKEELLVLLKAGMAAPTAVDRRPWAFVVVQDDATLAKLAEGLPNSKMIVKAGAAIVVCGDLSKALTGKGQQFWVQDCSAATENILLAAEATGLGAVWTGMYPDEERVQYVQKVLGIPKDVIPLNVIAVGHPVGTEQPKEKFDPSNIHWEKWHEK